ncbi:unnamed protein product [Closterium sp. Yama58-4]|nr:unnamed protein product [Closterium sp. Yama58-4]
MNYCCISRRRLRAHPASGAASVLCVAIPLPVTILLYLVAFLRVADGLVDCYNLTNPSEPSNLLSNPSFDTSCLDTGWRRKKLNASCQPWSYFFPWRALEPGEAFLSDEISATAFGGKSRGTSLAPAGATLAEAFATASRAAPPADVSIVNGVAGVADILLAADGSRFIRLTSDFSVSSSGGDGASSSTSNGSSNNISSALGGPGVSQALCELKPAAPTSNVSQQQQSPRQLSLSFFARASLCAEGEGGAEGEAERLLKVLLLAVPLNDSAAAGGGAGGGGGGEQVWGEWRVGVPCGGSSASLSGALPCIHPLLTAGSARRNRSSLSLTTLSDVNAASLALHPAPFALIAPATPTSPCRPFSFSTSFTFRISSPNAAGLGGEGLAFVMLPTPTLGLPGPSLGYGRLLLPPGSTTSVISAAVSSQQHRSLAVEFDTSASPEFFDRQEHHVGVNLDGSMLSLASAPVHPVGIPSLNAGQTLLATIQYNASSSQLTLWLSPAPSSFPPRSSSRSPPRSSLSSSSPPLPRSAVLTTFLDTCDWLGGNDPDAAAAAAAAPPPQLFVGFTAATGKGAEQAQAHEVLGWSFEVGEAEDPLPFWAADSFSFPYITPATPLLTRGSTRKRFFAADLSVAADMASTSQSDDPAPGALFFPRPLPLLYPSSSPPFPPPSFPLPRSSPSSSPSSPLQPSATEPPTEPPVCMARSFTFTYGFSINVSAAALPPPPGRLPSPVTVFSWTFRFTDTDPCKGSPVLPCGTGVCSKAPAPWDPSILVPSCKCPFNLPSFEPSHLSGLPSCFPDSFRCRYLPRNPCAPGVCINDVDGTYSCLCPSPFFAFYFYAKGSARCNQLRLFELRVPTFLSPYGLTCPLILNTYGLTQAAFFSQNKGFQCRAPIPSDTLINVTSRAFSQCTSMYTANYGDTCDSLNALFSTRIQPLNPALSCSDGPRPGQLLCVGFNRTWLDLEKTRVACQVSVQLTPAITTTPATPPPSPQPPALLVDYIYQGALVKVLQGPQSCQQLWRAFGIASPTRFFQMNPGLSCDSLLPYSPLRGNVMSRVCVAAVDARPLSGISCSTKRTYSVKRGDTCGMLIVKKYRRSTDKFMELNNGYDCTVSRLWIGMLLCLPV